MNQIDNGIHINEFKGEPDDIEMTYIWKFLKTMINEKDVRIKLRNTFFTAELFDTFLKSKK